MSAQICSLSLKVVEDCLETRTGTFQLFLFDTMVGVKSGAPSIRDTAMASKPLNVSSRDGGGKPSVKLWVRFA